MAYQLADVKNKVVPISCVKDLLKIRKEIEKNEQHRGKNYELVLQAYTEVRKGNGQPAPNSKLCRSACIRQMNKILTNWFKAYDRKGGKMDEPKDKKSQGSGYTVEDAISASKGNQLMTLDDRRAVLKKTDWSELLEMAAEKLGQQWVDETNGSYPPKKVQIIEALLEL